MTETNVTNSAFERLDDEDDPDFNHLISVEPAQQFRLGLGQLLAALSLALPGITIASYLDADSTLAFATAGLMTLQIWGLYYVFRRGHHAFVGPAFVITMLITSTLGVISYGSLRSSASLGFIGAVIIAGMFLRRSALIGTVVLSVLILGALSVAEMQGMFAPPVLKSGHKVWFIHSLVLICVAIGVYHSRKRMLEAIRLQRMARARAELAEYELRQSEERFSRIFRNSPVPILVRSADGGLVFDANEAFETMFGIAREQLQGQPVPDLWTFPDDPSETAQRPRSDSVLVNQAARARRHDGAEFDVRVSTELVGEGGDRLLISTVTDLSEERVVREELRRSRERLAKAFQHNPLGMSLFSVEDGRLVNAAAATLDGERSHDSAPTIESTAWLSNEERERFIARMLVDGRVAGYETQLRDSHGQVVDCRIWCQLMRIEGQDFFITNVQNVSEEGRRESVIANMAAEVLGASGDAIFETLLHSLYRATRAHALTLGEISEDGTQVLPLARLSAGEPAPLAPYPLTGSPCATALRGPGVTLIRTDLARLYPGTARPDDYDAYVGVALRHETRTIGILYGLWRSPLDATSDLELLFAVLAGRASAELQRRQQHRRMDRQAAAMTDRLAAQDQALHQAHIERRASLEALRQSLKSPTRAVEGFMRLLSEQMDARLGDSDRLLMGRIQQATGQIVTLIHDSMRLSVVNEHPMEPQSTSLSLIAIDIAAHLQHREKELLTDIDIAPGLMCVCDATLARMALEQIFDNALAGGRPGRETRVTLGRCERDGGEGTAYVVEDSGSPVVPAETLTTAAEGTEGSDEKAPRKPRAEFAGQRRVSAYHLAQRVMSRHGGGLRFDTSPEGRNRVVFWFQT